MEYRKFSNTYALLLSPHEEILDCLAQLCGKEDIRAATVSGLGAAGDVTLGLFDTKWKKYFKEEFKGEYEIASLTGNITRLNGEPYLHVHAVIGNVTTGETHAGHLSSAVVSATAELFVTVLDEEIERRFDEEIGLNLFCFQR